MWIKVLFKEGRVFAECDENGELLVTRGRVPIRYQLSVGAKIYQAAAANITPLKDARPERAEEPANMGEAAPKEAMGKAGSRTSLQAERALMHAKNMLSLLPDDTVICFVDGASRGNPGAATAGLMITWPRAMNKERLLRGVYLGQNTNNYAELMAVKLTLTILAESALPKAQNVAIFTDSKYVHGLFTQNWTAKANSELVGEIKELLKKWPKARFYWVAGHAGIEGNEIVDKLANEALDQALLKK